MQQENLLELNVAVFIKDKRRRKYTTMRFAIELTSLTLMFVYFGYKPADAKTATSRAPILACVLTKTNGASAQTHAR
jgi:hypothetical protein